MLDAGSSTMVWHELHVASDGQKGVLRDEVGPVQSPALEGFQTQQSAWAL